jgi:hypothetical protein
MRIRIRIRRIRIRILNTAFGDFDLIHNGYFMFFKCYRYRFDKETVVRLTEQLPNLERPNDRGRPLTPIQQVCITLGYFGGPADPHCRLVRRSESEGGMVGNPPSNK